MNKDNPNISIVTVGYNRPDAMMRLLNSLLEADYLGDRVDLIVSIDKGPRQTEIVDRANEYIWPFGEKRVRAFPERQGLRKHIVQCGDFALEYDAVIILEDDITVSRGFYAYTKQAVQFYEGDLRIGGISLYKHHVNVGVDHFFEPEFNGYDAFLMQFAQSWGQCWTTRMWKDFRAWYEVNADKVFTSPDFQSDRIPDNILHWGSQSWMKYYMEYIVEKDLFYIYPYHALTTNHSEVGQHNNAASADWQIETTDAVFSYRFPDFDQAVKYDIFFERIGYKVKGFEDKKVLLDLYGNKKQFKDADILISSKPRAYKQLASWKLKYRPHEKNCLHPEDGNGLYVYDLHTPQTNAQAQDNDRIRTRFDVRAVHWDSLIKLGMNEFREKASKKIKSKMKKK
jgi:glycosyltransferase involved in cell wall biosynthesis